MYKKRFLVVVVMACLLLLNMPFIAAYGEASPSSVQGQPGDEPVTDVLQAGNGADEAATGNGSAEGQLSEEEPLVSEPSYDEPAGESPSEEELPPDEGESADEEPDVTVPAEPGQEEGVPDAEDLSPITLKSIPQPDIRVTAETIISSGYITGFVYSGFTDNMMDALASVTPADFIITGADSTVTGVSTSGNTLRLDVTPFDPSGGYEVVYTGALLISLSFSHENVDSINPRAMTFILRNENYGYNERTVAAIIDAGREVDGSSLDASQFSVHARNTRKVDPGFVAYEGPRTITQVYVSDVDDYGTPSDTGRYIIIEFLRWGEGGENPDGGAAESGGYALALNYTITYNGSISLVDGPSVSDPVFIQEGVVSPVIDLFRPGSYGTTDYQCYINPDHSEPLPLVIVFHGWGQGNDNECYLKFSNSATVWAQPENQAKYPCHVLAPRNVYGSVDKIHDVMGVVNQWISDGLVDPSRIYVTGYSMGGLSTWMFLNTYPDVPAAAAPLCAVGGPASVEAAQAFADVPIWAFVTEGDDLYGMVLGVSETYGPYLNNYKLTILEDNKVMGDPYNGWVFHPHCVWIPVYNEYVDEERGMLIDWMFAQSRPTLPFILRNENLPFDERTVAAIIDTGKEVDGSQLDISMFSVHAVTTRKVDSSVVVYDGPRTITKVYTSQANDIGSPSDTGRYIVIEFLNWGEGGANPDGGAMDADGYTLDPHYTITYNGGTLKCTDGTVMSNISFVQTGVVSPVLDKFQYGHEDGLDYSYFINEEADGPLPLVIFFHGGGQGNDIYTPIRFSNGGTVWANPENQAKYPCHVLCPRNAVTPDAMEKVVAVINKWVDEGLVDPNRIYVTGFSMGGMSTWTFLNTFPDVPAAAAPICAAGAPASVDAAKSYANLPIWAFVTEGDFLYGLVMFVDSVYGPYMKEYRLTVFEDNKVMMEPYNGWVFDPHCAWIPAYNEYRDENGMMLIDWLFAQNRAFTDLKDKLDELESEIASGKYTYESAAAARLIADEVRNTIAEGTELSDVPGLSEKIDAAMGLLTPINQANITAAPNSVLMGSNRSVTFNISVDNLQKVSVMEFIISISDSRFEITDISTSYNGENSLFTTNLDYYGDGTAAYFSLAQVGGFADAARFEAATVTLTLRSGSRIESGESLESVLESVKMYFGTDGEAYSGIAGDAKASTTVWNAGDTTGDLDGNDIVTGNDLAIAMTFFAKEASDEDWFTSGAFAVDVNFDGVIDMADLTIIAYLAAHITAA